jgi:NitT/TauT family transport system permease protein
VVAQTQDRIESGPESRKPLRVIFMDILGPVLTFVVFFAFWEILVRSLGIPAVILPTPSLVVEIMAEKSGYLFSHLGPTLVSTLLGFVVGAGGGYLVAVLIVQSSWVREISYPYLIVSQVIPKVALAPLFIVWFGFGVFPKIVMAALICFFPVVINTIRGFSSVEPELVQFLESLGATRWDILRKLSIPSAMPYVFAGLKISIALAIIGAVVAEFVGGNKGLGYVILYNEELLETPVMFGALFLLSALGVVFFLLVVLAERYFVSWQLALERPPETL